ncbi:MFS transporter [Erwinia sp. MMLR14_017]|uniref:MFS transporter n=1 Tax=Erwinia sp. MMLR14_017 TaxID=3093842 RepID=UPI002990533A|nr:MFS transporter [Erwinia sp. MMLR14_017]MDW8848415.1 MFS transporter [Erwinia sp. MMLR14_017]
MTLPSSELASQQTTKKAQGATGEQAPRRGLMRLLPRAHPLSWWMLVITTLAILMNSIDRIILPTLLPAIMTSFNLTEVQAGWLNSLSFVGTLTGAVVFGLFSDWVGTGHKRCYSWCVAVLVEIVSGIATAFCKSFGAFQALRVAMGMGTGGSEPINVALLGEWWQKENRGFAIGVHHTGFPLGQFIGPILIAAILAFATWREAFLFIPLIGLAILVAQLIIGTRKNHQKVNEWIVDNNLTPPVTDALQHTVENASLWANALSCLKNRNCQLAIVLIFGFTWAEMGIANFLTLQLTREVGLDLSTAAIISGASGLTGWIGQILWGSFSDVKGRKRSLSFIIAGWILAAALCMFIHSAALGWAILIFWGLFRNSPYPVAYALLIDSSPRAAASSMGLMIGLAVGIAGILVAPVSGWIIHSYGFTVHYMVIVGVLLLSCAPLWFIKETVILKKA